MVFAFLRSSSSRAISPASIVLPRPVSSAMKRLTRGSRSALRSGSIWYASILMPARNGAWKRFGSVAVTQFQRSVWRKAANCCGGSKPLAARSPHASSSRMRRSSSYSQNTSSAWPCASSSAQASLTSGDLPACGGLDDLFDEPSAGAHLNKLANLRRALREILTDQRHSSPLRAGAGQPSDFLVRRLRPSRKRPPSDRPGRGRACRLRRAPGEIPSRVKSDIPRCPA